MIVGIILFINNILVNHLFSRHTQSTITVTQKSSQTAQVSSKVTVYRWRQDEGFYNPHDNNSGGKIRKCEGLTHGDCIIKSYNSLLCQ